MWNVIVYPPAIYPAISHPPATCPLCRRTGTLHRHQVLPATAPPLDRMYFRNVRFRFLCYHCGKTWTMGPQNKAQGYRISKRTLARFICAYARGVSAESMAQNGSFSRATAYRAIKREGGEQLKRLHQVNRRVGRQGDYRSAITVGYSLGHDTIIFDRALNAHRVLMGEAAIGIMSIVVEVWPVVAMPLAIETVQWMNEYLRRFPGAGIFTYSTRKSLERKIRKNKVEHESSNYFSSELILMLDRYHLFKIADDDPYYQRAVYRALQSHDEFKSDIRRDVDLKTYKYRDIDRIFDEL